MTIGQTQPVGPSSTELLERVACLGPEIEEAATDIAAQRRLPDALVEDLRSAGVFRMPMPASWGGPELDPLSQIRVLEELAYHDASVAWVGMICCDGGYYTGFLPDEAAARELYPTLDELTSGWLSPGGRATRVEGGWSVSGRWQFGSGILHADRIVGGMLGFDDGELVTGPDGSPRLLVGFLPTSEVEIHDTWYTTGLAGSGSNDYSVREVFVPDEHVFCPLEVGHRDGPLYRYHGWFFTKLVGVAIGAGRRAIDELRALAETKIAPPSMQPIKHEYRIQVEVARAEADLAACRALTDATLGEVWSSLVAGDRPTTAQRAAIGALGIWVTQTVKAMVDRLCAEAGTAAIYTGAPLERIRRDLTTMSHHLAGQARTYQTVGQLHLGLPTQFPIF